MTKPKKKPNVRFMDHTLKRGGEVKQHIETKKGGSPKKKKSKTGPQGNTPELTREL